MYLTPDQLTKLEEALIKAFPSHSDLAQMMYIQFGINLETIADGNLTEVTLDLIRWADRNNRLDELVKKARKANDTNKGLIAFEKAFQASAQRHRRNEPELPTPAPELNLIPNIGERLGDQALGETRILLYKGHQILGRFFTLHPTLLLGASFLCALLLLIVPAYLMGIGFMEYLEKEGLPKVGFLNLNRWNWWLMYPLVLPLLFAGTVWLSNYMRAVIAAFVNKRVQLMTNKDGSEATDFQPVFSDTLASHARVLLIGSLLLALGILIIDTWDISNGYLHHIQGKPHDFNEYDWSVAFIENKFKFRKSGWHTLAPNLLFDIIAYTFEGLYIFLGIFWTFKFWLYLKVFSNFMDPQHSPYLFNPMVYDPKKRLGLYPMGRLFNGFILIMIVFQAYILGHRLQQIHNIVPLQNYLRESYKVINPMNLLNAEFLARLFQYKSLDIGMVLLLFFGTLPIIIVSYFPLWTLRRYILYRWDQAYLQYGREYDEAREAGDDEKAKMLGDKIELLKDACIWPNGDITAKRFLVIMGTLAIAAIFPPLFIYGAIAFLLLEVRRYVKK